MDFKILQAKDDDAVPRVLIFLGQIQFPNLAGITFTQNGVQVDWLPLTNASDFDVFDFANFSGNHADILAAIAVEVPGGQTLDMGMALAVASRLQRNQLLGEAY
jgi:hypothetical protein